MKTKARASAQLRVESSVPHIQAEIERLIANGEIDAGERVKEAVIAQLLGVSRGPVREACRLLERVGLLKSVMNKGFYVRSLSAKEALDLYDLRRNLFGMAGRLAAPRIDDLKIQGLEQVYNAMNEAISENDTVRFYNLNTDFHQQVVEYADNYRLTEIWPTLESELQLFRRQGLYTVASMQNSNREHRVILDALASGNPELAQRATEQHIAEGKVRLLRNING
ncbi:GntR family transcriptional regulator [Ancylobacter aquaticus]|uniref:GntR family transcriptional regulator n=1 Tax=Ancylobacter aquaticus TaxID=100 RepID=A0A4R1HCD3_ANCAQ|nr:GntR family transcriptional regulator [Ancylobacter aquaticus]TCK19684.1 GntR family transcriptional regulator [Ancylobacter aquaticus]